MLIWDKAKKGTFTGEERETLICSNNEGTSICSSETRIITKILKLYNDKLNIQVMYYKDDEDGRKPTEVQVFIPKKMYFSLRSIKDGDEVEQVAE